MLLIIPPNQGDFKGFFTQKASQQKHEALAGLRIMTNAVKGSVINGN